MRSRITTLAQARTTAVARVLGLSLLAIILFITGHRTNNESGKNDTPDGVTPAVEPRIRWWRNWVPTILWLASSVAVAGAALEITEPPETNLFSIGFAIEGFYPKSGEGLTATVDVQLERELSLLGFGRCGKWADITVLLNGDSMFVQAMSRVKNAGPLRQLPEHKQLEKIQSEMLSPSVTDERMLALLVRESELLTRIRTPRIRKNAPEYAIGVYGADISEEESVSGSSYRAIPDSFEFVSNKELRTVGDTGLVVGSGRIYWAS